MLRSKAFLFGLLVSTSIYLSTMTGVACQQRQYDEDEFGPVVRAYLGYLRNEQEVVDDRVSRREINARYYRRNSNRIRALRMMAIRIARETRNDYLPELEAVAGDELGTLFEHPPRPELLRPSEVLNDTFRFLGAVRSGEVFYVFARLDIYEQAERREKPTATRNQMENENEKEKDKDNTNNAPAQVPVTHSPKEARTRPATRPRRASSP